MIDLGNVKKKILETVDKAGYITEKMLIDYCVEDNIPDYAIDQLCDQLFDLSTEGKTIRASPYR